MGIEVYMNLFEEVKRQVDAKEVAQYYGIKISRNGMACCPFHDDKHPSMKVDKNYHCFACGVGGDSIDFVARLFGLSQYEAVKKMVDDLGLSIKLSKDRNNKGTNKSREINVQMTEEQKRKKHLSQLEQKFQSWVKETLDILICYHQWLDFWKEFYKPENSQDKWNPLFIEALENTKIVDEYLDILLSSDIRKKVELFNTKGKEVRTIERRIEQYQRGILAEIRGESKGRC
jgi:hypothetical protein